MIAPRLRSKLRQRLRSSRGNILGFVSDNAGGTTRIDWDAFTDSWNGDVKQVENNVRNQVLVDNAEEEEGEDDGAPGNVSPRTPGRQHSNSIKQENCPAFVTLLGAVQEVHQRETDDGVSSEEDEPATTRAAGGLSGRGTVGRWQIVP